MTNEELQKIDISNLRFYARMANEFKWGTDVLHFGVIVSTLDAIADRLGAAVSASQQPRFPQICELCTEVVASAEDTEWHGLGNCVETCDHCMGSGIEPPKVDCPDCAGKGKISTDSAQVPWKLCPKCKTTGKVSSKLFAAAPAQEPDRKMLEAIAEDGLLVTWDKDFKFNFSQVVRLMAEFVIEHPWADAAQEQPVENSPQKGKP